MPMIEKDSFAVLFRSGLEKNGLSEYCTWEISDAFYTLTACLLETNAVMNLTAITEPEEIIVKHYADCMKLLPYLPPVSAGTKPLRLADIGTGAGFPSLPLAILRPDLRILAVDSTQKKLEYVARTAETLGLSNLSVLCARAEALGRDPMYRESFDIVTARAVAAMPILSEWCLPLLKVGGCFAAMKGKNVRAELSEAEHALSVLGGTCEVCAEEQLFPISPDGEPSDRGTVLVRKSAKTPALYPRDNAQTKKKPL